jgi:hypothetical protein
MAFEKIFRHLWALGLLVFLISLGSCSQQSAPSGKVGRSNYSNPSSGNFFARKPGSRKAPQMGFYQKREKANVFSSAKHGVQKAFSNRDVRHKLDNDKRSSSQNYANNKQKAYGKKLGKTFVKGKNHKSKRKSKADRNSDSFAAPTKKR